MVSIIQEPPDSSFAPLESGGSWMMEIIITYMYIVKSCLSFAPLESGGSWMKETIITYMYIPGTSRFQWSKTKATFNNVHVGDYNLYHPGTSRFQWSKTKAIAKSCLSFAPLESGGS
jgi:hypothetical protein